MSSRINVWLKTARILKESDGRLATLSATFAFFEVAASIYVLFLIKVLVDALSSTRVGVVPGADLSGFFVSLIGVGVAAVVAVALRSFSDFFRKSHSLKVGEHVDKKIHQRAIEVELEFYESPSYFDSLQRARAGGLERPAQVVDGVFQFGKGCIFLIASSLLMASIEWRILPLIAIIVLIALALKVYYTKRLFVWQRKRTQMDRKASYVDWLITSDVHAKELRISGIGEFLVAQYGGMRRDINEGQLRIEAQRACSDALVAALGAIVFFGSVLFLVSETLQGAQTVGNLVLFVLLFWRAEASARDVAASTARLFDNHLYLSQLFEFLDTETTVSRNRNSSPLSMSLRVGIEVQRLSFTYPNTDSKALNNVNLMIPAGKVVALVGENGCGKTTLVKLLCRLYEAQEGSILLDGRNAEEYDADSYRELFSVVFQDYARYAASAYDNIGYADVSRIDQAEEVHRAAARSGASFIQALPCGFQTFLTKLFDGGVDISVGQWQKLALARAFFRKSGLVILDEPSSALDPKAEFDLFSDFRQRIGDRAALIISHRLSTVQNADYTYVMSQGTIVEHGTHVELMASNGEYASLFKKQSKYFK